jgi:hypothetical protein
MNDHSPKNYTAALLLVLLGGFFGLHRFYVGKVATGILYLITFAFFGLGWILDIILVAAGSFTDKSGRFVKPGVQTSNTAPAPPPGEAAVASNLPSQSSSPSSTGDPTPITNGAVTPSSSGGPPRLEQTTPNDSQAQKPQPLPWWGWALIVVGSLALISFVFGGDDSEVTPEASENAPQQVDEPEPEPEQEFSDAALRMTVTDNTSDGIPEDFEVWIKGTGSWFYSQNSLIEEGGPFPVEEPSSFFIYPNGRDATVGADAFGEVQELEIRVPVEVPSDVIPGSPRDMIYIDVYDSEIIVSGTSIADSEIVLDRPQPDEPQEVQAEPESEGEEFELTEEDARTVVFPVSFEATRSDFIQVFEDLYVVSTVDVYSYDKASGTVTMEITPEFDFDEGVRDDAWEIFRAFGTSVYGPAPSDAWLLDEPRWAPNLRVVISSATYECDAETMRDLGDSMLGRSSWEDRCRVR